jgi:FkbM family methyltransferase
LWISAPPESIPGADPKVNLERHKITDKTITVPCISLTEALGNEIWDFVKIDIEGAEYEVIMSTETKTLRDHIKKLFVELHSDWPGAATLFAPFRKKLQSAGLIS